MKDSLVIGRVKGIQIEVHLSWFIIFALVTFSLATGYIPNNYPGLDQMTRWIIGGIRCVKCFSYPFCFMNYPIPCCRSAPEYR